MDELPLEKNDDKMAYKIFLEHLRHPVEVCVCVCVREREREREIFLEHLHHPVEVCVCVRERFVYTYWIEDDYRVGKRMISTIRRLLKMIGLFCKRAL